jgi:hypothetical protein
MIRKRGDEEHKLQVMVVDYLTLTAKKDIYWFAIPNAGLRTLRMGARMKREGLRSGIADLAIMLPGGRMAWLEMKTKTGRQSVEQKNFQQICLALGHPYAIARSFEEAEKILKLWGVLK